MSGTSGDGANPRARNLVSLARPYFGLIVLATALLTGYGVVSLLQMPSGIYPEVDFPRIVAIVQTPGLAVKDVEVAVTRPIEESSLAKPSLSSIEMLDALGEAGLALQLPFRFEVRALCGCLVSSAPE